MQQTEQRIGSTSYLVEMSTDGRTLSISAYDGETQTTFDLVLNEKTHRKLRLETQGDYSLIFNRLRIENGCLKLKPAGS